MQCVICNHDKELIEEQKLEIIELKNKINLLQFQISEIGDFLRKNNITEIGRKLNSLEIDVRHTYDHDERIDDLEDIESEKRLIACEQNYTSLLERIKNLEEKIDNRELGRKPYKCPVCNGTAKRYIDPNDERSGFDAMSSYIDEAGFRYKKCTSCEGKGIVWG